MAELDLELKEAVRKYILQIVTPLGIFLSITSGVVAYLVKSIAYNDARNEVYNAELAKLSSINSEASVNAGKIQVILSDIGAAEGEIDKSKELARAASGEAAKVTEAAKKALADAANITTDQYQKIIDGLYNKPEFVQTVVNREGTQVSGMDGRLKKIEESTKALLQSDGAKPQVLAAGFFDGVNNLTQFGNHKVTFTHVGTATFQGAIEPPLSRNPVILLSAIRFAGSGARVVRSDPASFVVQTFLGPEPQDSGFFYAVAGID